jgi:two-component system response regulator NreC
MDKITLLLVDDHEIVRTGLRMLLENQSDIQIVGEANSSSQAVMLAQTLRPDIIIMDLTLPDLSGIETTRLIKSALPGIDIIALTIHEDEQHFFEMLKAGASGYVPKRAAPQDLITAIRAAHEGHVYIYPTLATALVTDYLGQEKNQPESEWEANLTQREQEVLEHLADGLSNDEIAEKLVISPHTVARHREHIMKKLNLHSRSELVKYAIRKGMIEP